MDAARSRSAAPPDTVIASARAGEPDRYLAALLAPLPARGALLALAAFSAEVSRVPLLALREPTMGEIRLQWWRDQLALRVDEGRTGSPVADALLAAVAEHALPREALLELIEARSRELAGEPPADDAALELQLWRSEGILFALAARTLAGDEVLPAAQAASVAAGQAYGLARLLLTLPLALARGRVPLPLARMEAAGVARETLLAGSGSEATLRLLAGLHGAARARVLEARRHVADLPREYRPAFLPLALVRSYLRAVERRGRDVLRRPAGIAPATRVARILLAHWLGRP